ncbi:MAG: malectin [Verrucomicrobiota bacterium]
MKQILLLLAILLAFPSSPAKSIAYIYGDVAANGTIPSGAASPYDQMLLTDSGNTGLSQFKTLVENQGYTISQHYDQTTTLDSIFLNQFDAIIFGLHQKTWSLTEQTALNLWLNNGGGILMYSDSAAGGLFSQIGIKNQTGQTAVNSILANYGMQVAVDQGGGTRGYQPDPDSPNPIIWDQPTFEGEGVSPIAVDPNGSATVLIPLDPANRVSNGNLSIDSVGITIANPIWAAIAHTRVGDGNIIAIFDRQPIWNNGPGSDINEEDNEEILRRIIRFLALDYGNSSEWLQFTCQPDTAPALEVSFRQWTNGVGQLGFDYTARNNKFALEQQAGLTSEDWPTESNLVETVSRVPFGDNESEIVTLRLLPDNNSTSWFARLSVSPDIPPVIPVVSVNGDSLVAVAGSAWLEGDVTNASSQIWSKLSGPGTVTFNDSSSAQTTATFSQPGSYQIQLTASSATDSARAMHLIEAVATSDITVAINCGGSLFSANTGITYSEDQYFNGGGIDNFPNNPVAFTDDDALYNTARSKNNTFTGYTIPVPNGNYLLHLQFAETFFTSGGSRVFDTSVEGSLVIDNLDLAAVAGKWVAYTETVPVTVSDRNLDLTVTASANNPLLNAIVVVSQT